MVLPPSKKRKTLNAAEAKTSAAFPCFAYNIKTECRGCGCPVDTSASAEAPTEPAGETAIPYDVLIDTTVGADIIRPQR